MRRTFQATIQGLRRRLLLAVTLVAVPLGWGLLACNAPFIPVPPPENVFIAQSVTDNATGATKTVWVAHGKPDARAAGAKFFLFNQALGGGVIAEAGPDGTYTAPALDGAMGDHVFLYYTTTAGVDSEVSCRVLSEQDPAPHCPP
jgi:hypothetical protein